VKVFGGQNEAVLDWLSQRVNFSLMPQTYLLWASTDFTGPILGAIGFGGLMGKTLGSVSIALDEPRAAIPLIRASTRLIWGAYEAKAAYIYVSSKRMDWMSSLQRVVGFEEVDRVVDGQAPGEDLIMLKLTPESCRPWQAELNKTRMPMREVA
jgi:hypothetical protein